ncbi:hypothetical protein B0W47_00500 [Komagataeibacter nataicola]|uniref:Uncharacterized protein n=1 Tax=Komagataeibacter nataicola TaxID=265960 RepID=A0A9N7C5S1_9PROT|nr:hypothetical protein B0W47_00500 [Komagataeibacter nataicola]PYD65317.1 hypothetical protein CDI09_14005 [Komagataeibacter nataicola]
MNIALPTIEKGIPMPPVETRRSERGDFVASRCIGDSFACGPTDLKSWVNLFKRVKERHSERKFSYRKTETGFRIWRVS